MNEHGRKRATIVAALLMILASVSTRALASETSLSAPADFVPATPAQTSVDADASAPEVPSPTFRSITLFRAGDATTYQTTATTVGAFLTERGIVVTSQDRISYPIAKPLTDGMNIAFHEAMPMTIVDGTHRRPVRTTAQTVRDVLVDTGVRVDSRDEVSPLVSTHVRAGETIRITRISRWTTHRVVSVPVRVVDHYDRTIASGVVQTMRPGRAGLRVVSTNFERRNGVARRVSLASRIVRVPQDRVIVHGIGRFASLASMAKTGFNATVHFAGQALSMIATAYTAACYGCSGITASGVPAGHGIVAVDPSVIPLGTRLFIPGYGAAVAGDTGGAIIGHRIDLGFDSNAAAIIFGRRPITVYVVK